MAEKYYGISPYAYCAGNPVNLVDQMGLSPIYNTEGRFLGTDDEGLQGQPIIIANDSFIQGLSHVDAMKLDLGYKGLSSIEAVFRLLANYTNLPNRPDYDGYVSVMEGIQWAKNHPNALKNPTAENTLYIDTSKLDFGLLSTTEFQKENTVTPINLFTVNNSMAALYGYRIGYGKVFDTIYALGRVNIILLNRNERTVQIVNDDATKYDWNPGGGSIRNLFILGNNALFHINPEIHGFNTYYYGKGKLHF